MRSLISRHPLVSTLTGLAGLTVAAFLFLYFEPQKLFIEDRVNEDLPKGLGSAGTGQSSPANSNGDGATTPASAQPTSKPTVLATGNFRSLEHESSGKALIIQLPDGSKTLRFEDFKTSNGPDLVVYLSPVPATAGLRAYGEGFVDLGHLKGNIGDQNFDIPSDIDLRDYKSAVVWCRRFSVGFAVAPLG